MINKFPIEVLMQIKAFFSEFSDISALNEFLENRTGIINFFSSPSDIKEFEQFLDTLNTATTNIPEQDLGDFQTPICLTDKICRNLADDGFTPDIVIESTCGEGNFVISAIRIFPSLKYIYCMIHKASMNGFLN